MCNLQDVADQIKAVAISIDGPPSAKLIAVLEVAGVTDSKTLSSVLNISRRAVQKVRVRRTVQ